MLEGITGFLLFFVIMIGLAAAILFFHFKSIIEEQRQQEQVIELTAEHYFSYILKQRNSIVGCVNLIFYGTLGVLLDYFSSAEHRSFPNILSVICALLIIVSGCLTAKSILLIKLFRKSHTVLSDPMDKTVWQTFSKKNTANLFRGLTGTLLFGIIGLIYFSMFFHDWASVLVAIAIAIIVIFNIAAYAFNNKTLEPYEPMDRH